MTIAFRLPLLLALAAVSPACARSPALMGGATDGGELADADTPASDDGGSDAPDLAPPGPPPLGGTLTPTGATFKVWAPHADAVTVSGDFDNWGQSHVLTKGAGDVWSGDVDGAQAGQRYRYLVSQGGQSYKRSDPRA
ncbi:MAG: hypothetical protein ACXVDD_14035, partial [Polyangia bacterium]